MSGDVGSCFAAGCSFRPQYCPVAAPHAVTTSLLPGQQLRDVPERNLIIVAFNSFFYKKTPGALHGGVGGSLSRGSLTIASLSRDLQHF